ncbi:glycosyltransferase family 4 protein [Paracoccus sediminilitoris]|uniref:glycosyltransferase family 4 protein n=1 Tax=Paracoccus sediminilitoris TaxID=2202419 RepID=UPI000DB96129|nr:glycosyltransferase family 4 protein [Paracoccus sediminilitoris]
MCHRIAGIPYSLVLHGPLVDCGPDQPVKWQGADFVFIITETLLAQVAKIMPQMMDRVRVVPMGVNIDHFAPPDTPRITGTGPFTWFCCARLNQVEGHNILIQAAMILRRDRPDLAFRVRIAGEDEQRSSGYHRDLDRLIAQQDPVALVELLGPVTQKGIRAELQAADGIILVSRHEPLGVAYMEAMACELPVIRTDAGGVRELVTEGQDGLLVAPDEPQALADAMARLMQDPASCRRMGEAARQRVLNDFSARRSADALTQMLKEP